IGYATMKDPNWEAALVPDKLKRVEFIMKDRKRFPGTSGWGYARFLYDSATGKWTPYGKDANFAQECYSCHTGVKAADYIFTRYPMR
ncbi:MAG TPA: cytochrome P460 family protein, partial [Spirochaetota bacterium]